MEIKKQQWLGKDKATSEAKTATTMVREVGGGATQRIGKEPSAAIQGAQSNTNQMNQNIK
jgi:hypothetical protein